MKQIKAKASDDASEANDVTLNLDDRLDRFKIGMPMYKEFD